jgi:hypothetical protein
MLMRENAGVRRRDFFLLGATLRILRRAQVLDIGGFSLSLGRFFPRVHG